MNYAIVDLAWAASHGIEILPEFRQSVDMTKVILHEERLVPFKDEDFPRYSFADPDFTALLNSSEWTYPEGEAPQVNRELSRILALDKLTGEVDASIQTMQFTDEEKLKVKKHYPEWEPGMDVKQGECYNYGGDLWESLQDHTTQENWKPGIETLSIWKKVDGEKHAGTQDDPIPYEQGMSLDKGKYYAQFGVTYECIQASGPLVYDLYQVPALAKAVEN